MVLFGWLVLLVASMLSTFWVLDGMTNKYGLSDNITIRSLAYAIIPAILWCITLSNVPFAIVSAG